MIFTSVNFLLFFPLVAVLFWITTPRYRWLLLLVASYYFYINIKPVFALLLAGTTFSTYIFTRLIDQTKDDSSKKKYLSINIILILLPLFFFKYFNDVNEGVFNILNSVSLRYPLPQIKFLLPIGISFYTFVAIGYTIDVYNEGIESEKNPGILALFISFFPLILSGPIERGKNLLPQFNNPKKFNFQFLSEGFRLMLWGYFLKLVVADRLGLYVDAVYNNIPFHNGSTFLVTAIIYPFQVYADLGGYSLVAIGTAKMIGIDVMQNFKRPFFATSMSEFWRRWHISLISWLTDYLYTPLSFLFRKFKIWGIVLALMITFFISGIWHGASMTFVVWGLMQGIFLSIEALTNKQKGKFEKKHNLSKKNWYLFIMMCITFILFAASQIFGRAETLSDSLIIFKKLFSAYGSLYIGEQDTFLYSVIAIFIVMLKDFKTEFYPNIRFFSHNNFMIRITTYIIIIVYIGLLGVFDGGQFIYFQF